MKVNLKKARLAVDDSKVSLDQKAHHSVGSGVQKGQTGKMTSNVPLTALGTSLPKFFGPQTL